MILGKGKFQEKDEIKLSLNDEYSQYFMDKGKNRLKALKLSLFETTAHWASRELAKMEC